jgi:hypothetical protein
VNKLVRSVMKIVTFQDWWKWFTTFLPHTYKMHGLYYFIDQDWWRKWWTRSYCCERVWRFWMAWSLYQNTEWSLWSYCKTHTSFNSYILRVINLFIIYIILHASAISAMVWLIFIFNQVPPLMSKHHVTALAAESKSKKQLGKFCQIIFIW